MAILSLHRLTLWCSGVNFGVFLINLIEGRYSAAAINFFASIITYGIYHIADERINGF